jgi:uroporphyrinogen-III decarboxylase
LVWHFCGNLAVSLYSILVITVPLSKKYAIDVNAPEVQKHNEEVRSVLHGYQSDRPVRVPLLLWEWFGQHGCYTEEYGIDYRDYYTNPDLMAQVQLESARRKRELPICDVVLGELPAAWEITVDFWPAVAAGWFGCELMYRKDCVIAYKGLHLSREECDALEMPDPKTGGILNTVQSFWTYLKEVYENKVQFLSRPIGRVRHGVGINGVFSLALDLRGAELMLDMYEDPDFARRFINKVADWCDILERTWERISHQYDVSFELERTGNAPGMQQGMPFAAMDHGIDMLSAQMYEEFLVPVVKRINRQRGTTAPTVLHHCGRGSHLFPMVKKHFGLTHLDALTYPMVDIARVRRELGEDIWITAIVDDGIIQNGPAESIRQAVEELMQSGVKGNGRFALIVGDMLQGVPLEHRLAYYEAVKEFGGYSH